ncbi:NH(3)-dependent NAD(+) synthetase [Metallosphaera sedula]|uniref:NH(3)-dependent NAD(+) synthetase n=4 Tax=Metallosphaera TaxID=41980 RepID=A4YEN9_METS5|nr:MULTISPECIES: NAD+ synthase [Metallosphaera]ABP94891.1 NH(3)-dependent NAD(+) synthetase [Metallosphaera sedula DSM 5348]AIM26878.1 NH(3)-dependent NAD(+) synthetase [Metallosphaera sedula]MCY0862374.1 NAD+ synthase [Metallosphaera prunae]QCO29590.1 NAD+ synthase [Metallosphaera prunae]WPX06918.1 NAD+ synthase [Metallosphaera sedula DSM 5348]
MISNPTLKNYLDLDYGKVTDYLVNKLRDYIRDSGKKGGVVGVSGGIDSAVTATLLSRATQNFYFLIMPSNSTPQQDLEDALHLTEMLNGKDKRTIISIDNIVENFSNVVNTRDKLIVGNIKARTRMILLYAFAQKMDYLVIGTGDKSELLLGYFTKYGDGGVDVLPIGDLFKTQVRKLGEYLKLPSRIVSKPSSPALWEGQTAEGELGVSYEVVDPILYLLEKGKGDLEITSELGVNLNLVRRIRTMVERSRHKRLPPEIFKLP